MGLDMYLSSDIYLSTYDDAKIIRSTNRSIGLKTVTTKDYRDPKKRIIEHNSLRVKGLTVEIGYWRKANQIHKWFVDNVQDGNDNCERHRIDEEKIEKLVELCESLLATQKDVMLMQKDEESVKGFALDTALAFELMPPTEGFFFGYHDGDQHEPWFWHWYVIEIQDTLKFLKKFEELREKNSNFKYADLYYQSSW